MAGRRVFEVILPKAGEVAGADESELLRTGQHPNHLDYTLMSARNGVLAGYYCCEALTV